MKIKFNAMKNTFSIKGMSSQQLAAVVKLLSYVRYTPDVADLLNAYDDMTSSSETTHVNNLVNGIKFQVVEECIDSKRYGSYVKDPCIELTSN